MNLLIVTGIFPPDDGGPARYVPTIAAELAARGHRVIAVVTLSDAPHDDANYPFPVVRLSRGMPRLLRMAKTVATIARLARGADAVYLNGLVMEGVLACRLAGARRVVIKVVGDLIWEKARNAKATDLDLDAFQAAALPPRWRVLRRLQSLYTAAAHAVIVPSAYLGRIVREWGVPDERVHVVYNAVEPAGVAKSDAPEFDLVTVARLVPWKGLEPLIAIAAARGLGLLIVGDGPLADKLKRSAESSGARVVFAGRVPPSRVAAEIRRARLFVLNSTYEGLPHIVLEAKHAGVAVLASNAGGTPETIVHGDDGWLVEVGNAAALDQAIAMLLSDDALRARLARRGQETVNARFSLAAMVSHTEAVLAGMAAAHLR